MIIVPIQYINNVRYSIVFVRSYDMRFIDAVFL